MSSSTPCRCSGGIFSFSLLTTHFSPMGVFEFVDFANGSKAMLDAVVMATEKGATSIIGQLGTQK